MGGRFWTGFLTGTVSVVTLLYLYNNWKLQEEEEKKRKKDKRKEQQSIRSRGFEQGEEKIADDGGQVAEEQGADEATGATVTRSFMQPFAQALINPRPVSGSNFFLSDIVKELWSHIDAVLSASIRESIEPMFASMGLPGPLATLRFTKFSLGSNPIKLENVVVHEADRKTGVVKFNMDVDWEADCDIELKADYVGSLGIQSLIFRGKLEFLLHPMDKSPIVSAIEYSLVNQPEIDFDFTGIAQLADLKVVKSKIIPVIQDSLASMLVLPMRMLFLMDTGVSFADVHTSLRGVARVTLHSGKGFKVENLMFGRKDVPDVYCTLSLGNKTWTSKTIQDSVTPDWNESADFCLSDSEQYLVIHAHDSDEGALDGDDYLGFARVTVAQLLSAPPGGLEIELTDPSDLDHEHSKKTGASVTVSVQLLPFIEDLSSLKTFAPSHISGLIEIIVLRGFDLPIAKETASTYVKVTCGKHEYFTGTVADYPGIDALNPIYDCFFLLPIEQKEDVSDIVFTLYNTQNQTVLGTYTITSEELKKLPHGTLSGKQPIGEEGAGLEVCVSIRGTPVVHQDKDSKSPSKSSTSSPLPASNAAAVSSPEKTSNLRGIATDDASPITTTTATTTAATPTTPNIMRALPFISHKPKVETRPQIGTIRITAVKGWGFKPIKRVLRKVDVPDVYLSIHVSSSSSSTSLLSSPLSSGSNNNHWRTATIWNDCNPEWNESKEFPLYDASDSVNVSVYDDCEEKEKKTGDLIGSGSIVLSKLLANPTRPVDITIKKKTKGTVGFIALRAEQVS